MRLLPESSDLRKAISCWMLRGPAETMRAIRPYLSRSSSASGAAEAPSSTAFWAAPLGSIAVESSLWEAQLSLAAGP